MWGGGGSRGQEGESKVQASVQPRYKKKEAI